MSVLTEVDAAQVHAPDFDKPDGMNAPSLPISKGTRVVLVYHGKRLSAQVTAIERLGTSFVGRVMGFAPHELRHDGLAAGDSIRFRHKDVHRID